ncbi:unnamed protein product [Moneuplotes crassus]|uniref:Cyclic nucleotide-binding domain-containing protein n=1 Tax=Euplotes crassus TaxID=5936 RepID=A0AAD1UJH4_EUPCR|nr:unnamed protein product [Moneuplotes crassus]
MENRKIKIGDEWGEKRKVENLEDELSPFSLRRWERRKKRIIEPLGAVYQGNISETALHLHSRRGKFEQLFCKIGIQECMFRKTKRSEKERSVTFPDVRRILRKNGPDRKYSHIQDLAYYFRNQPYFVQYEEENGVDNLHLLFRAMKFQTVDKDKFVIKYGEIGTKFYIILRGSVSVRIPSRLTMDFSFRSLLEMIVENKEWIIDNERFIGILMVIQRLIPEIVETSYKIKLNYKLTKKILKGERVDSFKRYGNRFPGFQDLQYDDPYYEAPEEDSKEMSFDLMHKVATLSVGFAFGELALMNNSPRAATIQTEEDCQFAIINKIDFKVIMDRIFKKRYADTVSFLSEFSFLDYLTRKTKERLCHHLILEKCGVEQKILTEGEPLEYIYLIKKGEFEVTKSVFINPELAQDNPQKLKYLKLYTRKQVDFLRKLKDSGLKYLVTKENIPVEKIKEGDNYQKKTIKISKIGDLECFGLIEAVLSCPYSVTSIKCMAKDSEVYKIKREEFFIKVQACSEILIDTVKQRMILLSKRFLKVYETLNQIDNNLPETIVCDYNPPPTKACPWQRAPAPSRRPIVEDIVEEKEKPKVSFDYHSITRIDKQNKSHNLKAATSPQNMDLNTEMNDNIENENFGLSPMIARKKNYLKVQSFYAKERSKSMSVAPSPRDLPLDQIQKKDVIICDKDIHKFQKVNSKARISTFRKQNKPSKTVDEKPLPDVSSNSESLSSHKSKKQKLSFIKIISEKKCTAENILPKKEERSNNTQILKSNLFKPQKMIHYKVLSPKSIALEGDLKPKFSRSNKSQLKFLKINQGIDLISFLPKISSKSTRNYSDSIKKSCETDRGPKASPKICLSPKSERRKIFLTREDYMTTKKLSTPFKRSRLQRPLIYSHKKPAQHPSPSNSTGIASVKVEVKESKTSKEKASLAQKSRTQKYLMRIQSLNNY